eukprot:648572-Prymnesium_polylepis.1
MGVARTRTPESVANLGPGSGARGMGHVCIPSRVLTWGTKCVREATPVVCRWHACLWLRRRLRFVCGLCVLHLGSCTWRLALGGGIMRHGVKLPISVALPRTVNG